MPDDERMNPTDHDLLIQLNTRFGLFVNENQKSQETILLQLNTLTYKLDGKADKSDVRDVEKKIDSIDARVKTLEDAKKSEDVQKETVLRIGLGGVKLWQILVGAIVTVLSVMTMVGGIINMINQ